MRFFYSTAVRFYGFFIGLAAFLGTIKAKQWKKGRKNWAIELHQAIPHRKKLIWIHAASLGEFEQARPLIEKIKKEKPEYFLLLSFFSPSGFEIQKDYKFADEVCYLPLDTPLNARKFINIIKPELTIMVKYEFWFNFLNELHKRKVKTILISGIFRPSQHFFKWYGSWFRKQLQVFDTFFLQNKNAQNLLNDIGYNNAIVSGDTRFDRVYELAQENYENKKIEAFCAQEKTIIFGSSWDKEHGFAKQLIDDQLEAKIIIAPHEVSSTKIDALKKILGKHAILWSELSETEIPLNPRVLIIDQIGMLSKIYRYATLSIIGGGFGAGIHNILEAAVYGCPTIFGPNFKKFQEAKDLIEERGAFTISDYNTLKSTVQELLTNTAFYASTADKARNYVEEHAGATDQVYQKIFA
ncbi:MAG: glycosyltransferase N-terminal domain-containing protein [Vicingaceae bacterium]